MWISNYQLNCVVQTCAFKLGYSDLWGSLSWHWSIVLSHFTLSIAYLPLPLRKVNTLHYYPVLTVVHFSGLQTSPGIVYLKYWGEFKLSIRWRFPVWSYSAPTCALPKKLSRDPELPSRQLVLLFGIELVFVLALSVCEALCSNLNFGFHNPTISGECCCSKDKMWAPCALRFGWCGLSILGFRVSVLGPVHLSLPFWAPSSFEKCLKLYLTTALV